MSHRAVFLAQRLYCGHLMKASPELQWFESQPDLESWVCECKFGLQVEIIQPYCLKVKWENNTEDSIGNVLSDMIDEGKDEGQMRTGYTFSFPQLNTSSLQTKSEAAGLKR